MIYKVEGISYTLAILFLEWETRAHVHKEKLMRMFIAVPVAMGRGQDTT